MMAGSHPHSNAPGRRKEDDSNLVVVQRNQFPAKDRRVADAISTVGAGGVATSATVRRFTCSEVERLQGFPDGHTCLCGVRPDCPLRRVPPWIDATKVRLGGCGHSACGCKCSDGYRYRQMGNAAAISVVRWIADRLKEEGR
jgi:site-specific DNA-cytosine methylase